MKIEYPEQIPMHAAGSVPLESYAPPLYLRNGHVQTIYPALFRKVTGVRYQRERIETADGDFLDLDWSRVKSRRLAIISHGLEGSTDRSYVRGMARALNQAHIDILAWNYRGCSGVPNRSLRMYHNGVVDDLHEVVAHACGTGMYDAVFLIGFSLGGNLSLLYLGKDVHQVPSAVKGAVVFSVPCDLTHAAKQLEKRTNKVYMRRFLLMLHDKIKAKQHRFPEALDDSGYHRITTFKQFDDRYTAPIHGFADARDYWEKCSSRPWITSIGVPVLIINALDDPFLTGGCYPIEECQTHPLVTLSIPRWGGHVGFMAINRTGHYWSESQAVAFIQGLWP
jgi:predicted alpha/beta-fold hydrolase